jgi:hypothetical protein
MIVHQCNVNCHAMEAEQAKLLGVEDLGKWMPFMFDMDMVVAAKLTSDDEEAFTYNCTTIFTNGGDTYVIDTPYTEFFRIYKEYKSLFDIPPADEEEGGDDISL